MINHIFWANINFITYTKAWLLADLLNQDTTYIKPVWQSEVSYKTLKTTHHSTVIIITV